AHALAAAVVDGDERLQDAARRGHERGVGLGVDVADDEHAARPEAAQERCLPQRQAEQPCADVPPPPRGRGERGPARRARAPPPWWTETSVGRTRRGAGTSAAWAWA